MRRRRLIHVPATSANLGPGFDVMAAALSPVLTVEVEETGSFAVQTELPVPDDRTNLVVRAFEKLHPADDFTFRIRSEIPLTGGLGSSASAVLAGLAAADHIFELGVDLLEHATELEGHPDNAAAALHGGFVICVDSEVIVLDPPSGLEAILVIPPAERSVPTAAARAALPAEIPIADAVFNVAHASLLAMGIARSDLTMISHGLADRLHQPRRAHLYSESMKLVNDARSIGALGATISGAGPSVLVWTDWESTGTVFDAVSSRVEPGSEVRRVAFTAGGIDIAVI